MLQGYLSATVPVPIPEPGAHCDVYSCFFPTVIKLSVQRFPGLTPLFVAALGSVRTWILPGSESKRSLCSVQLIHPFEIRSTFTCLRLVAYDDCDLKSVIGARQVRGNKASPQPVSNESCHDFDDTASIHSHLLF